MSDEIKKHNLTVLNTLEVGDMVRFERKGYYHYGVYDGEGNVYHLTGKVKIILGFGKQKVRKEDIMKVAGHSRIDKDNTREDQYDPLDTEDIIALAELYLATGTKSKYNLRSFNCETFASMLRYGSGLSKQDTLHICLDKTDLFFLHSVHEINWIQRYNVYGCTVVCMTNGTVISKRENKIFYILTVANAK